MSSSSLIEVPFTLSGASGTQSVLISPERVDHGELRFVIARLSASTYTFTAFRIRMARYPKDLITAGVTLDQQGRVTSTIDASTAPDERMIHDSGAIASPGTIAASATTAFYNSGLISARRLWVGPACLTITWTSSAGTSATGLVLLESQQLGNK